MYFSALEKHEQQNSFIPISPIEVSKFLQEKSVRQRTFEVEPKIWLAPVYRHRMRKNVTYQN